LAGRDDFILSGEWTRAALDKAMLEAFQRGSDLAAGDFSYAYQHAKAYYEVEPPRWEEALGVWERLGGRATTTATKQLVKLHRANVLVQLDRIVEARALLDEVTDLQLMGEKKPVLEAIAAKLPAR
ncbi:MAG: hypothetical protein Q8J74_00470, partial [Candidatus Didemnitutus sp.]|nr:hypothetical protein [Candidatus Didemnitutus sp.]